MSRLCILGRATSLRKRGDSGLPWGGWQGSTWGNQGHKPCRRLAPARDRALSPRRGPLHGERGGKGCDVLASGIAGLQPHAATGESAGARTRGMRSSRDAGLAKSSPDARLSF